ncbi:hypothetical protein [Amycolatopsis sp. lyj-109]|uniref:hypothetical protein n=1 Tax=Amycolatopsis sp. lyj-109 TaxID=2789287 RepID=UPI00397A2A21
MEELLAEAGTEACVLAREALTAGTPPQFWDKVQHTQPTRSLYGRRELLSRRAGQGSIGFEAAVRALCAYPGATLARVQIDDRPRGRYYFELFLTPDFTRIVACFGVGRVTTHRESDRPPDAPPWSPLDEIVHSHKLETPEKVAKLQDVPDVAAGLAAGLERTLAMRRWESFRQHADLVPAFPSPAAERHLTEARARIVSDEYVSALLVAIIDDALAAVYRAAE